MTAIEHSRRRFLRQMLVAGAIAPAALAWRDTARANDQAACYDPATLPLAQRRQRRAVGYAEPSTDAIKRCGRCAFFTPDSKVSGCGTCQLLSGGPVAAAGLCNSYAPKAGSPT